MFKFVKLFLVIIMKYNCNVNCPFCGHSNSIEIPKNQWLMSLVCQVCKEMIIGKENPHGWNWVLCAYGDTPWVQIQARENKK